MSLGLEARTNMRLMALVLTAAVCAVSAADAAPRLKRVNSDGVVLSGPGPGATTVTTRDEFGRTRTRILVQKRSYLDGGTEVMPADNINSFRSTFMSYRPGSAATQNTAFDRPSWVNDPFFLPGKRNPYPWLGN
jgi:hypothetical protein